MLLKTHLTWQQIWSWIGYWHAPFLNVSPDFWIYWKKAYLSSKFMIFQSRKVSRNRIWRFVYVSTSRTLCFVCIAEIELCATFIACINPQCGPRYMQLFGHAKIQDTYRDTKFGWVLVSNPNRKNLWTFEVILAFLVWNLYIQGINFYNLCLYGPQMNFETPVVEGVQKM